MLARTLCGIFAVIALSTSATEYRLVDIVAAMYEKGERVVEGPEWGGRWEFRQPSHPWNGYSPDSQRTSKEVTVTYTNGVTETVMLNGFSCTQSDGMPWMYPLTGGRIDERETVTLENLTYYPGEVACHPFNMLGEGFLISFTCDRDGVFELDGTVRQANINKASGVGGILVWTYDWHGRMENINFNAENDFSEHRLSYGPADMRKGQTFVIRLDKGLVHAYDATAFNLTFNFGAKTIPRREFKQELNLSQRVCSAIKEAGTNGTQTNAVDIGDFVASFGYKKFEQPAEYPENIGQTSENGVFGLQTSSGQYTGLPIIGASIADEDINLTGTGTYGRPIHPGEFFFHPGYKQGVTVRLKVKDTTCCANRILRVKLVDLNPIWGGKTPAEHPACREWSTDGGKGDTISWGEAMRVYVNGVMRYEGAMRDGTNANANITDIIADLASFDITDIKAGDEIELRFRALHDYQGEGIDCDATSVALEWGRFYRKGIAVIVR